MNPAWNRFTFALATALLCANASAGETAKSDLKTEVEEAVTAIRGYAEDQRDDALDRAQGALARLDARIERLEARSHAAWDDMSESAREQTNEALRALRRRRNDLAEWYGAMKHSSSEAWAEVREGFSEAYLSVHDAVEDAREEF